MKKIIIIVTIIIIIIIILLLLLLLLLLFYHLFTYLLEKLMSYLRSPSLEILFHTQLKLKYSSEYRITQVLLVPWFYSDNMAENDGTSNRNL